ncbi:uncharacterized protein EKO05_0010254 [Ascochyta rabiei]|uniref:uncharacterized protein n=1 Tax=Didymella rabiei TaxID=5454 RepID=UPI00220EEF4F|nr:uncharacterized protein EKO05_0010254 [Ascochyta rabiei]UPX20008.1 hypothetical protein EKO05_0010254 [Ascochyta rabiei]
MKSSIMLGFFSLLAASILEVSALAFPESGLAARQGSTGCCWTQTPAGCTCNCGGGETFGCGMGRCGPQC